MTATRRCLAATIATLSSAALQAGPWEPLFNGKDLAGWAVLNGTAPYTVEDGAIVGRTVVKSPNSFLATSRTFGDFIVEMEIRQLDGPSNGGVQFRSESRPDYNNGRVHGYQFEIDPSERAWTGGIYDEARRGWLYTGNLNPGAQKAYKYGEWNVIRIEAIGSSLRTWVNGQPVAHVIDNLTPRGFIALQVHGIGERAADVGHRTMWRNLRIQTTDLMSSPPAPIFIRNAIPNDLSAAEKSQGWRLAWDGKTSQGWRGIHQDKFPAKGWSMVNGELIVAESHGDAAQRGGDLVTVDKFSAFEFELEFKVMSGANSGIKYFIVDAPGGKGGGVGPEFQLLDDEHHPDAKLGVNGNRTLGSLYDLIPRGKMPGGLAVVPRIGEWQHARIVVRADNHVEHWLNGIKVVDYQLGRPEFLAAVALSKFSKNPDFAKAKEGHLLLQEHGNEVHFRSIKIRPLK